MIHTSNTIKKTKRKLVLLLEINAVKMLWNGGNIQ